MQRRSLLRAAGATTLIAATPFVRARARCTSSVQPGLEVEASGAVSSWRSSAALQGCRVDVTIDTGNGSARPSGLVGSGAYDAASADLSTISNQRGQPQAALKRWRSSTTLNPNAILAAGWPHQEAGRPSRAKSTWATLNAARKRFRPHSPRRRASTPRRQVGERDARHRDTRS